MLAQGQYDEFAAEVHLLAAPLRAALPQVTLTTYNMGGRGRPGLFVFGTLRATAKYRFPISLLIRWRDPAILDYLESDADGREALRRSFGEKIGQILADLASQYFIDWQGGSQDSGEAVVIELEEF